MAPTCRDCGHQLSCVRCATSRAGQIGGRTKTPARVAAARAASKAPRPGRRAYDVIWADGDGPRRMTLSQVQARAQSRRVGASLVDGCRFVGHVKADGSVRMRH